MVILEEHLGAVRAALYRKGTQITELAPVRDAQELAARELVVLVGQCPSQRCSCKGSQCSQLFCCDHAATPSRSAA